MLANPQLKLNFDFNNVIQNYLRYYIYFLILIQYILFKYDGDKSLSIPPDCIIIDLIIKAVVNISRLTHRDSYYESRSFLVEKEGVGYEI